MRRSAISCCMHFHQGAGDFGWAIHAAQRLLAGQNPYDTPLEQYPLTAAFFALPFVALRPEVAGALFYGISSALLAFGLTRHGYHRLLRISRLSLLGRTAGGAVVDPDLCQRLLPSPAARDHGQAPTRDCRWRLLA